MSMKLPNSDRALIPMEKLTGYCLNPNHSKGKHKARVFQSVLNLTADNADVLSALIQQAAIFGNVVQQDFTPQGQIFKVDWEIPNTDGRKLRTTWEITHSSEIPRLITAFIK
jgi:hypothetical protein